jgi:hypothetical protein
MRRRRPEWRWFMAGVRPDLVLGPLIPQSCRPTQCHKCDQEGGRHTRARDGHREATHGEKRIRGGVLTSTCNCLRFVVARARLLTGTKSPRRRAPPRPGFGHQTIPQSNPPNYGGGGARFSPPELPQVMADRFFWVLGDGRWSGASDDEDEALKRGDTRWFHGIQVLRRTFRAKWLRRWPNRARRCGRWARWQAGPLWSATGRAIGWAADARERGWWRVGPEHRREWGNGRGSCAWGWHAGPACRRPSPAGSRGQNKTCACWASATD